MVTQQTSDLQNWTKSISESLGLKFAFITLLILLLLIPSLLIQNLISERQSRQTEVVAEISDKWSGRQMVTGPVLILPYKSLSSKTDSSGKTTVKEVLNRLYVLPEQLRIRSNLHPEVLHRGIFDAAVYGAKVQVSGYFSAPELQKSGIDPTLIQWEKAKVTIGLSDLKGLRNNPTIRIGNSNYSVEPDFSTAKLFKNDLSVQPNLAANKPGGLNFSYALDIRGSEEISFLHTGKNTEVEVRGNWDNPSFTGRYLPDERRIDKAGFTASWKLPYFNRPFPQQWLGDNTVSLKNDDAAFGTKFLLPVDQYQKTMRSAKYAILIILLSFISLLFTEILSKKSVHFLQYALIGAAMIIYYTLLLSFSEQVGFDFAYLIASVATIALISLFIHSVLKSARPAWPFAGILGTLYGFIYVIIQLQDLALIFGSIGLFVIIALLMYLSAKINWNKPAETEATALA